MVFASLFVGPLIGAGPPLIGIAHASGCLTNCLLNATTSVPISDGKVFVEQDNNSMRPPSDNSTGLIHVLPHLFQFANYSIHTITVLNLTLSVSSTGARYVWKQWYDFAPWTSNQMLRTPQMLFNYTGAASFVAQFDKQFQLSLTFTDQSGQPITPPALVTLQSGTSTTTLSSYSNQWVVSNVWTVTGATWEGFSGPVAGTETIDLTNGAVTKTIPLLAYPATIQILDKNNNPISGASVIVTFANSTSTTLTSDSKGTVNLGHIPQGSFSAQVFYQNQNEGTWSLTAINAPTNTIQLNVGGGSVTSTTVSAVVLLTIFGIAFFLVLLAIKVRRPAPPPTI